MMTQRLPLVDICRCALGAGVVRVVDVLHDRLPGAETIRVWQMMEEDDQVLGRGCDRLVHLRDSRRILARVSRSGGDAAVHADALVVGADPLSPAVALGG